MLLIGLLLTSNGNLGAVSAIPVIYIMTLMIIAIVVIYQNREWTTSEYCIWILVNLAYLANGLAYFIKTYGPFYDKFSHDFTKMPPEQFMASRFICMYVFFVPILAHGLTLGLKVADSWDRIFSDDEKESKKSKDDFWKSYRSIAVSFIGLIILLIISVFLFVKWTVGLVIIGIVAYFIFLAVYGYLMLTVGKGSLDWKWKTINRTVLFIGVSFGAIWQFIDDKFSLFEGISYTTIGVLLIIWSYALFALVRDNWEAKSKPVYYSDNIIPVF